VKLAALAAAVLLTACATVPPEPVPAEASMGSADELFRQGIAAAEAGDLGGALGFLERAVAAAPDELRHGAEYRQVAIRAEAYDRSIGFFESLAEEHPDSPEVRLQWGYAYVDKIPAAGAVTAVILANTALDHFTEAIEREESWLALYTRGNSYVYWPPIFGRTGLGIADLEKAVAMSEEMPPSAGAPPAFHAHAYAALGDAHWRLDDLETAAEVWRRGLERIPGSPPRLTERLDRLERGPEALDEYLQANYEVGQRVDTSLRELWSEE
jgi:tetratricopeptide (TPR) repeat protein